jgi:AcrR family transcriptional regulator
LTGDGQLAESNDQQRRRVRMSGRERRQQLVEIGRRLFAERGYEATSVEEIAERASVSKPVVYEHFGGKEGLYAVIVEGLLAKEFKARGYDRKIAPLTSQALVGMVALTGQWWLDAGKPSRREVAAHLVNLAWNGLKDLDQEPMKRRDR